MHKANWLKETFNRTAIVVTILLYGCTKMSETIRDESAGINGGFEVVKSGLPVNWLFYTAETIPTGEYDLIIDTNDFKEGSKSLQFSVQECSATGGWHSPGFSQQFYAIPGEKYKISFWIKNDGCEIFAKVGGVSPFEGDYDTIIKTKEKKDNWIKIEYYYSMPSDEDYDNIRFELSILQPGTFWIDDIKIEDVKGTSVIPVTS